MKTRNLLIGATVWLGVIAGAVVAQAPPPVPALPDSQRLQQYTVTSGQCACAIGFSLYGDQTDVDEWIQVYIGVNRYLSTDPTFGWTIISPTGPLGNIARPINDGLLTFNSAQTGTVTILGAQRPRRLSEFAENRGVPARDHNQVLNTAFAELREMWDKVNGALIGQPSEVILRMPPAATRANQVLAFDGLGNPTVVSVPSSIPSGQVVGPGSSVVGDLATWCNTLGNLLCDTATLGVAHGGTGAATFGAHGVLIGEATAPFNVATTGTGGAILVDQGALNDPAFKTVTGDVTFTSSAVIKLAPVPNNTVKGNVSGLTANPTDLNPGQVGSMLCVPQRSIFISGTALTYSTPTCNGLLPTWIEVELQGGGASGGGSGTSTTNGTAGNASTFSNGVGTLTAGGGATNSSTAGGASGTCSGSLGTAQPFPGTPAGSASNVGATSLPGGLGGISFYGGAGAVGPSNAAGGTAPANSGGGGAGGSANSTAGVGPAGAGGPGCHWSSVISTGIVSSYTYTIGLPTTGASAGTSGNAGGGGAQGLLILLAHWQ